MNDQRTIDLITECRDALAEELGAWDIDPPLHHVKSAHSKCVAWLDNQAQQQAEPVQAEPVAWVSNGELWKLKAMPGYTGYLYVLKPAADRAQERSADDNVISRAVQAEPVVEPARDLAHEKEMRELRQQQIASDCADDSGNPSF